jgi:hypothetical protein
MDALCSSKALLLRRDLTAAAARAGVGKIFKKTLCVAGLRPAGRDLAKDLREDVGILLPLTTVIDHGRARDVVAAPLNADLTAAEPAERKTGWGLFPTQHGSGALWKDAHESGPAVDGAVIHPGRAYEKRCDADI